MPDKRILLVEPKTRTSYPPLGLMKIATYHKICGDYVRYVSGKNAQAANEFWDKICITSVFTYDMNTLVDTIRFYSKNLANRPFIEVGGIAASLLPKEVQEQTGIKPHVGLQDTPDPILEAEAKSDADLSYLLECATGPCIDNLPPDYGIFEDEQVKYSKILDNSYFFYTTKGCPNACGFCAVTKLEPNYVDYIPIQPRIEYISKRWGEKAGLLLLDNNIAASTSYDRIIDEIKDCGFGKGEKLALVKNGRTSYRLRHVDFNQGVDLRLMTRAKMQKMASIAIKPLRLAFDNISLAAEYEEKARMAIDCGIDSLSNYMLFNFNDTPEDLYQRFQVNLSILRDHPKVKIFSFPMRYSPVSRTDRKFIGKHWIRRELRAIQLILNATHGIVSHKQPFFNHAFGHDQEHYRRLLLYPQHYIINREYYEKKENNGFNIARWEEQFSRLGPVEKAEFREILTECPMRSEPKTTNKKLNDLLEHYRGEHSAIIGT